MEIVLLTAKMEVFIMEMAKVKAEIVSLHNLQLSIEIVYYAMETGVVHSISLL